VSLRAIRSEGKFVAYFFLTGFFGAAFFFAMVAFNFGLDFAGAFFTGINVSSCAVAAAGRALKTFLGPRAYRLEAIIETRYAVIKHF
jgi:hypothetical protein